MSGSRPQRRVVESANSQPSPQAPKASQLPPPRRPQLTDQDSNRHNPAQPDTGHIGKFPLANFENAAPISPSRVENQTRRIVDIPRWERLSIKGPNEPCVRAGKPSRTAQAARLRPLSVLRHDALCRPKPQPEPSIRSLPQGTRATSQVSRSDPADAVKPHVGEQPTGPRFKTTPSRPPSAQTARSTPTLRFAADRHEFEV
jgi:hypothetical protein